MQGERPPALGGSSGCLWVGFPLSGINHWGRLALPWALPLPQEPREAGKFPASCQHSWSSCSRGLQVREKEDPPGREGAAGKGDRDVSRVLFSPRHHKGLSFKESETSKGVGGRVFLADSVAISEINKTLYHQSPPLLKRVELSPSCPFESPLIPL